MYNIVIVKKEGIISRPAGNDLQTAITRAKERAQDMPEAIEIRVNSPNKIEHVILMSQRRNANANQAKIQNRSRDHR